jgi:predicted amino acid dehydrogenase
MSILKKTVAVVGSTGVVVGGVAAVIATKPLPQGMLVELAVKEGMKKAVETIGEWAKD